MDRSMTEAKVEDQFIGHRQILQSPREREKLDGLHEYIVSTWLYISLSTLLVAWVISPSDRLFLCRLYISLAFDLGCIMLHLPVSSQVYRWMIRFQRCRAYRSIEQTSQFLFGISLSFHFQLYENVPRGVESRKGYSAVEESLGRLGQERKPDFITNIPDSYCSPGIEIHGRKTKG